MIIISNFFFLESQELLKVVFNEKNELKVLNGELFTLRKELTKLVRTSMNAINGCIHSDVESFQKHCQETGNELTDIDKITLHLQEVN